MGTTVYINQGPSILSELIIAGLPALVALAVVFIGGRQSRSRLNDQLQKSDSRWADQQAFEQQKFALQERRTLYAEFLNTADKLIYCTYHATGHRHDHATTDAALQEWMEQHDKLSRLSTEIQIVGSMEFVQIANDTMTLWSDWIGPILDADPDATAPWSDDGSLPDEDGPDKTAYRLLADGRNQARREISG